MRFSKETLLVALAAGTFGMAGTAGAATVLTGEGDPSNTDVTANHGSNAAGTPNITLAWDDTDPGDVRWDQYNGWPNDAGDGVYQIDGAPADGWSHTIAFTPDAGWNVVLTSLDTNVWVGGGATDLDWSVDGSSSGNLGSGTYNLADDSVVTQALGFAGTGGETLTITFTQTSGLGSYLAIDNIAFDQVQVPEPGSAALLAGLGALAMRRKRK